jgi:hypothetical protein
VSLASHSLALAQSPLPDEDEAGIVRAVLEAEMGRQRRTFVECHPPLDRGDRPPGPGAIRRGLRLTLLTPGEIKERAGGFVGARHLVFEDFKIEGARGAVRLAVAMEATRCSGTYYKHQKEFTYRLEKAGEGWKAEPVGHPLAHPDFGVKPNNGIQRTRN